VAGFVWKPPEPRVVRPLWDWVYEHHAQLVVVLVVAAALVGVALATAWRGSSWRRAAWAIPPAVIFVGVLVSWGVGDRRSLAGDIEGRVREVTAVLPPSASQTATNAGDNFLSESYVVPDNLGAVANTMWTAAREKLGPRAGVWTDPGGGSTPTYLGVSFTGRNGCDGSVQVNVILAAGHDETTVEVSGGCED
jgi:hypothetical protein